MLCGHKSELKAKELREIMRLDYSRYFKQELLKRAVRDFVTQPLSSVLYERHGLVELEFSRKAVFKSQVKVEAEMNVSEGVRMFHTIRSWEAASSLCGCGKTRLNRGTDFLRRHRPPSPTAASDEVSSTASGSTTKTGSTS
jgi:hypothetical protein